MGPYRDSISLKKSPLLGLYTGSEAQLDLATVRYHALGAYAKSVYLVFLLVLCYVVLSLCLFSIVFVIVLVQPNPAARRRQSTTAEASWAISSAPSQAKSYSLPPL